MLLDLNLIYYKENYLIMNLNKAHRNSFLMPISRKGFSNENSFNTKHHYFNTNIHTNPMQTCRRHQLRNNSTSEKENTKEFVKDSPK